jgi:ATP-binding cassette subfamily F protein 3
MVSHDRHLIGLVCDTFWRVADGVVEPFAGDLDEYAAWLRTRASAQGARAKAEREALAEAEANRHKAPAAAPAPAPVVLRAGGKKPANPVKLAAAEKKVGELEAQLAELDAAMADPAVFADAGKLASLSQQRENMAQRLEQAEADWLAMIDS